MFLILGLIGFLQAFALQSATPDSARATSASWVLVEDGRRSVLPDHGPLAEVDSVLATLEASGHYFARISRVDSSLSGGGIVHIARGPRFTLEEVVIEGMFVLREQTIRQGMATREGGVLREDVLEADLALILSQYEQAGHPLASVQVMGVDVQPESEDRLRLHLRIDEGPAPVLRGVRLIGEGRTRPTYVARLAGLREGRSLRYYSAQEARRRLHETGYFRSVGEPRLEVDADSGAYVVFTVEEQPPGAFDLVLGFLPPTQAGGRMALVGNGHLEINNLFGAGRAVSLRLNRLPGQVSEVEARASDPFILGLPLRLELQFQGLQRDSTYAKHRYGIELGVRLSRGLQGFGTFSRESTRPGVSSASDVARADAWFAGVGARLKQVDNGWNPTRGYTFEIAFESGRKNVPASVGDPATSSARGAIDQERVRLSARGYMPIRSRQVLVLGFDGAAVLSGIGDQSDLIRYGGARTLRGFDEDRFLARTAGRGLAEFRYLLDPVSYAFAFFDAGYIASPKLGGIQATRGFHPGYGLGMRFETAVGLVSASYAISSEAGPANGRIHVGLSLGL